MLDRRRAIRTMHLHCIDLLKGTDMLSPYSTPEVVLGQHVLYLGLLGVTGRLLHR